MVSVQAELVRPLRRIEYDQLVALGAFEDERIELLDGALVRMSPIGAPHAEVTTSLAELLTVALFRRARIRTQAPFAAGEHSEPEPDIAVVPLGDYSAEHPERAHLIVEVAESSLRRDRGHKARLYAESGVPEYWIVNIIDRTVEVHSNPAADGYLRSITYPKGASIRLLAFPDLELSVDDFLK